MKWNFKGLLGISRNFYGFYEILEDFKDLNILKAILNDIKDFIMWYGISKY